MSKSSKAPKSVKKAGPSNRHLMFQALHRNADGLSSAELRTKIGMSPSNGQFGVMIRGEIAAKRIRVERQDLDTGIALVYFLTALGHKHATEGKVDSVSKEKHLVAAGRAWEKTGSKVERTSPGTSKKAKKAAKKAAKAKAGK